MSNENIKFLKKIVPIKELAHFSCDFIHQNNPGIEISSIVYSSLYDPDFMDKGFNLFGLWDRFPGDVMVERLSNDTESVPDLLAITFFNKPVPAFFWKKNEKN